MDRRRSSLVVLVLAATSLAGRASAHGGSLGPGARDSLVVPTWLFLTTGGATVGASFLLASFVTDRSLIAAIHDWRRGISIPGQRLLTGLVSLVGLAGLAAVLVIGFLGPSTPVENVGYLLVWVGWWAGFTMSTYLVGNAWPALNPWRTLAGALPTLDRPYPERYGAWPAVAGLLALVYLEIVGPPAVLADTLTLPVFIATLALAYSVVTLAGATYYGYAWFDRADPVSRVFRYYGRVAPVEIHHGSDDKRNGDHVRNGDDQTQNSAGSGRFDVRLPGAALAEPRIVEGSDDVAFVVALLWATTFDGLVSTPAWQAILGPLNVSEASARLAYLVAIVAGFVLFRWIYYLAVDASRDLSEAHLSRVELARRFAPPLLSIAAGYHLAHYLGYFLRLAPGMVEAFRAPLTATGSVLTLQLPDWFGGVGLASILLGHLLAIWVAHASAYDRFPSRLQAIRSQYPFIAVMVLYTMTSLWILSQPVIEPPYL